MSANLSVRIIQTVKYVGECDSLVGVPPAHPVSAYRLHTYLPWHCGSPALSIQMRIIICNLMLNKKPQRNVEARGKMRQRWRLIEDKVKTYGRVHRGYEGHFPLLMAAMNRPGVQTNWASFLSLFSLQLWERVCVFLQTELQFLQFFPFEHTLCGWL